MHYGIEIATFGEFGDPRTVLQFARATEAAGWEALWVWDRITVFAGVGDPWVIFSAVAASTERLKLCVGVAPLPRYRPHVLARLSTSLDILSDGRLILGAGIGGVEDEFTAYGESGDAGTRAAMLDEGLEVRDSRLCRRDAGTGPSRAASIMNGITTYVKSATPSEARDLLQRIAEYPPVADLRCQTVT